MAIRIDGQRVAYPMVIRGRYTPSIVASANCTAIQSSGTVDGCQQVTVAKPAGEQVIYTFSLNGDAWDSQAQYYSSSGALIATTKQVFNLSNACVEQSCSGVGQV